MLSRTNRIQGDKNVARVYRRGRGVRTGQLGLKYAPNQLERSRLAVVVSKKVSKSAPRRNLIRRRLYECFRRTWPNVKPGFDLVLSAFSEELAVVPAQELDRLAADLLQQARLWDAGPPA